MARSRTGKHAARRTPAGRTRALLLVAVALVSATAVNIGSAGSASSAVDLPTAGSRDDALVLSSLARRGLQVSRDSSRQAMEDKVKIGLKNPSGAEAEETNAALVKLAALAEKAAGQLAKNGWQLPVAAGVYHLTAGFGQCSSLWAHCHTGLDFAAPTGTPIHAVANGVIIETGWAGAYGNRTVERLDDGTELWYCHQSAFEVKTGDTVVGGQVIGLVGATGNTTGPHLHLEVRPGGGDPVDPKQALIVHGVTP